MGAFSLGPPMGPPRELAKPCRCDLHLCYRPASGGWLGWLGLGFGWLLGFLLDFGLDFGLDFCFGLISA